MFKKFEKIKIKNFEEIKPIINALNHHIRWEILQILNTKENDENGDFDDTMINKEIHDKLKEKGIYITRQMLGQHMKILMEANLIDRVNVKRKIEDKSIPYSFHGYYKNDEAVDFLLLSLPSFEKRMKTFIDLYNESAESIKHNDLVITVFNGTDKGKQLAINKDEEAYIGKIFPEKNTDYSSKTLVLSNSYETVSNIRKPHLKVYNKDGTWYILDKNSTHGTYCYNEELERNMEFELPNNSFIKLADGPGCAFLYFSYD